MMGAEMAAVAAVPATGEHGCADHRPQQHCQHYLRTDDLHIASSLGGNRLIKIVAETRVSVSKNLLQIVTHNRSATPRHSLN
jgi:hypothetical protein